ncbi:MAG: universal stress protein [Verrucomicrobia bacterium]|nr:universal stress protein [Verrucomicrobiota bacterium]
MTQATGTKTLLFKRILVPIDFSEHSTKTIDYAAKFATFHDAVINLLHVFQIPDYVATHYQGAYLRPDDVRTHVNAAEREAKDRLADFEKRLRNRGVQVQSYLGSGYAFEEIVNYADTWDIDLIIIGSRGSTGLVHLLLGSTAMRVAENARCPVLIIKENTTKM